VSTERAGTFVLQSEDFPNDGKIPSRFTCDGENQSPSLYWTGAPPTAMAFALLVQDLDVVGEVFVHWLLFNIPADINQLPAAMPRLDYFELGTVQARNSFERIGYDGPCPSPGKLHHYRFTLFALDAPLGMGALTPPAEVIDAIETHTLDQATLVGTYQRLAE
jgi:Raf kinase inhibitor-like YbhB/YbcL family protein